MARRAPLSPVGKRTSFWTPAMQDYCVELFGPEDEYLEAIAREAAEQGFPQIAISPADGQVLRFLVAACGARRAVEIGTLAGYSALWIARALPADGRLDTFELEPARAAFAREHIARAQPPAEVVVHEGPALERLDRVDGPVDFVFIDADKEGYPDYVAWAMQHLRPGGIVALDNSFAWGGLADPRVLGDRDREAQAMRRATSMLATDPRFIPAMIPTNEGLAVALKR